MISSLVEKRSDSHPEHSTNDLLETMYEQLKLTARRKLAGEFHGRKMQTTALVHEAYLRLNGSDQQWGSQHEFFRAASESMRRILVDQARARLAAKRGSGFRRKLLSEVSVELPLPAEELVAIHEVLQIYAKEDPQKAKLVEMRVFGGVTLEGAADALGIARATAVRHWAIAKLRLMKMLSGFEVA